MYRTFDDWSARGYKILKGSKATIRNGKPKFSETQVENYSKPAYTTRDSSYDTCPYGDGYDVGGIYGMGVDWE